MKLEAIAAEIAKISSEIKTAKTAAERGELMARLKFLSVQSSTNSCEQMQAARHKQMLAAVDLNAIRVENVVNSISTYSYYPPHW